MLAEDSEPMFDHDSEWAWFWVVTGGAHPPQIMPQSLMWTVGVSVWQIQAIHPYPSVNPEW